MLKRLASIVSLTLLVLAATTTAQQTKRVGGVILLEDGTKVPFVNWVGWHWC